MHWERNYMSDETGCRITQCKLIDEWSNENENQFYAGVRLYGFYYIDHKENYIKIR